MPKKSVSEETEVEVVEEVKASPKILVRAPKEKVYSFEQWAKIRNIPDRHFGGMRAFLGTQVSFKFSLDKWDEIFGSY
ncbi:hypothetical protein HC928_00385 [bacterium]|nr:hypothetical protein [bacterium]